MFRVGERYSPSSRSPNNGGVPHTGLETYCNRGSKLCGSGTASGDGTIDAGRTEHVVVFFSTTSNPDVVWDGRQECASRAEASKEPWAGTDTNSGAVVEVARRMGGMRRNDRWWCLKDDGEVLLREPVASSAVQGEPGRNTHIERCWAEGWTRIRTRKLKLEHCNVHVRAPAVHLRLFIAAFVKARRCPSDQKQHKQPPTGNISTRSTHAVCPSRDDIIRPTSGAGRRLMSARHRTPVARKSRCTGAHDVFIVIVIESLTPRQIERPSGDLLGLLEGRVREERTKDPVSSCSPVRHPSPAFFQPATIAQNKYIGYQMELQSVVTETADRLERQADRRLGLQSTVARSESVMVAEQGTSAYTPVPQLNT
ncbi:hypothetical protein C8Q76DRAFT_698704 [Earliella scabrosa]|nr:hypothetical protein C8Q76DRAFT_698704 [Earliella scabrosa]